jgi:hypothetical protein
LKNAQVDFNVAFKSPKTIGSFFPFKDQIKEKTSQSLIVYKIRILVHRLKEHQKKKQTTNKSACYEHIKENPTHEMDYESIQVIDRASSNFKLRMKELLHILKEQPELKKQVNSQSDYEIKRFIIYKHIHNIVKNE